MTKNASKKGPKKPIRNQTSPPPQAAKPQLQVPVVPQLPDQMYDARRNPRPKPEELVSVARSIIGAGTFPEANNTRERLLRDALGIWRAALDLVNDYEDFGTRAINLNHRELQDYEDEMEEAMEPTISGKKTIALITGEHRPKRARAKLEKWLNFLRENCGTDRTIEKLELPMKIGEAASHKLYFQIWNSGDISEVNAKKGRASAKQKAAQKAAAEKKKRG